MRHRFAGREEDFDPPDFGSLACLQPLQSAVAATFDVSRGLSSHQPGSAGVPERFAWRLVRDAAETTAAELGIPVGDLTGYANVLEVEGLWWYLAGPGCALCSAAAAVDPLAATRLLREVFSIGPGREAGLAR